MRTATKEPVFNLEDQRVLLGQKLALARLKHGITQLDALRLSGLIKEHPNGKVEGVTKGFLTYVESGRRTITQKELTALANLYQTPVKWFTDGKPLSINEQRVLMRLLSSAKRRTIKPRGFKETRMTTQKADRHIVSVIATDAPRKRGRPRKHPLPEAVVQQTVVKNGDQAVLSAIKSYNEAEKRWIADVIPVLVSKMRSDALKKA